MTNHPKPAVIVIYGCPLQARSQDFEKGGAILKE